MKSFEYAISFNQLLNIFDLVYPELRNLTKYDIVLKVEELDLRADKPKGNIIEFYNNAFVGAANKFMIELKNNILSFITFAL